ncbi:MAG: hypothetical protein GC131_09095 [Alphaproteobacteria bacterium]|nr:hypothetical protein [Alphaproteobacteria bacterium]
MQEEKAKAVRRILNVEWNPAGIPIQPDDDEYDSYVAVILQKKWSQTEPEAYLGSLEYTILGAKIGKARRAVAASVAEKILSVL